MPGIGELADTANHHSDLDLRFAGVTVRLSTHGVGGLSDRDASLARQISAAARELGATTDPAAVQHVQVAIDALDTAGCGLRWPVTSPHANADSAGTCLSR